MYVWECVCRNVCILCVYVYLFVCVCVCVCMYVSVNEGIYVRMHGCKYVCYVYMYECVYVSMHVWMHCCMCICSYLQVCMCVCVYVCIYLSGNLCMEYICMRGSVCIIMYVCMYVCVVCMYVCEHSRTHARARARSHAHAYVWPTHARVYSRVNSCVLYVCMFLFCVCVQVCMCPDAWPRSRSRNAEPQTRVANLQETAAISVIARPNVQLVCTVRHAEQESVHLMRHMVPITDNGQGVFISATKER
jgi:hypothetical protein